MGEGVRDAQNRNAQTQLQAALLVQFGGQFLCRSLAGRIELEGAVLGQSPGHPNEEWEVLQDGIVDLASKRRSIDESILQLPHIRVQLLDLLPAHYLCVV